MRRSDEHFDDRVFVLGRHAAATLAAARLRTEGIERSALDVPSMGDRDDHFLALDQVFVLDPVPCGGDFADTRGGVGVADFFELFAQHAVELYAVGEDREVFLDRDTEFLELVSDLVPAQSGQAVKPKIEDRFDLPFGQAVGPARLFVGRFDCFDERDVLRDVADRPFLDEQLGARLRRIGRTADHRHDLVKVGHGDDQAKQDMRAFAGLVQFELRPPRDDLFAEADEGLDEVAQREDFGPTTADRQHVGGKARLRGRVTPDLVEDDFGRSIALEVDHHADAFTARFVADVRNAFDPFLLGGFGDLFDQCVLADLVGDRGEHDRLSIALGFDLMPRAHQYRSASGRVGRACTRLAQDERGGREIGTGDDLEQLFRGYRRVIDIGKAAIDHFAQIVRRNIGRHADGNAARAVDQQVWEARGQYGRLAPRTVVIVREIDRVLVEIVEQRVGDPREPRFGISHAGRRIGVHRTEVALTIDQGHAQRPVLRHAGERVVNRGIAVRVIVAHHVADDLGALAIGAPGHEAAFLTGEQDPTVNRLQTVAHIGQRAADDHAHRVIEIARLHLIDDVDAGVTVTAGGGRFQNVGVV